LPSYSQALVSVFVAPYDSQGYGGGIRTHLHTALPISVELISESESEAYVMTDCQSASLSWNKASICGLRQNFHYCQTFEGLLMWGAFSDERTGLSFTIAAGPRQRGHFRVRVPWDS
jgi:hypothetical protein